jgi:hypothetical protein
MLFEVLEQSPVAVRDCADGGPDMPAQR